MTTAMDVSEERLTLSVQEAARALGISRNSLYTALACPSEPINRITIRIGKRYLISRRGLLAMLEAGASAGPTAQGKGEA